MDVVWKISTLERNPSDGFVIVAHWTCTASEDDLSSGVYGTQSFEYDPEQEGFVPFEDLTEEMVVGWVHEAMTAEKVEATEDSAKAALENMKNPPVVSGVPW